MSGQYHSELCVGEQDEEYMKCFRSMAKQECDLGRRRDDEVN